jgi:hypothetical protein
MSHCHIDRACCFELCKRSNESVLVDSLDSEDASDGLNNGGEDEREESDFEVNTNRKIMDMNTIDFVDLVWCICY